jgi:hypothetical protein
MEPVSNPATHASMPPLVSGHRWVRDNATYPDCAGRNDAWSMKAADDARISVRAKTAASEVEVHSLAMERVAFVLGDRFGLSIPATYVEVLDGRVACVQRRVTRGESWLTHPPSSEWIERDARLYAKCAIFDVAMANTDRNCQHLLYSHRSSSETTTPQLWLVDHGYCGMWPPGKLVNSWEASELWSDDNLRAGGLSSIVERQIANIFPPPYRTALHDCPPVQVVTWLEELAGVFSEHLDHAIAEVSPAYIGSNDAEALKMFLTHRLKSLALILGEDDGWMALQSHGIDKLVAR